MAIMEGTDADADAPDGADVIEWVSSVPLPILPMLLALLVADPPLALLLPVLLPLLPLLPFPLLFPFAASPLALASLRKAPTSGPRADDPSCPQTMEAIALRKASNAGGVSSIAKGSRAGGTVRATLGRERVRQRAGAPGLSRDVDMFRAWTISRTAAPQVPGPASVGVADTPVALAAFALAWAAPLVEEEGGNGSVEPSIGIPCARADLAA